MDIATCVSAAGRHLNDTETLHHRARYDNAAYLAGYVAECALKSVLTGPGLPAHQQLGHDLRLMTGNALLLAVAMSAARRRYNLPVSQDFADLVATWKPDERYAKEGTVSAARAEARLNAARESFANLIIPQLLDHHIV